MIRVSGPKIQDIVNKYNKLIDEKVKIKEAELMEV